MRIDLALSSQLLCLAALIVAAGAALAHDGDSRAALNPPRTVERTLTADERDGAMPAHWLRAQDVARTLAARGFTNLGAIRRRGGSYLLEATTPRHDRVRLVVDAASGEINGMQVIEFGRAN